MTQLPSVFEQMEINHIGFAVDDIEGAVERWSTVYGAGPFFVFENPQFDELFYRGQPLEWTLTAAFGWFGSVCVELSKYEFASPMPELVEMLAPVNNGYNHTCYLADDTERASARLVAMGFPMFIRGRAGDDVWFWHDARHELGHCIELHSTLPHVRNFAVLVAQAANGWDGTRPYRTEPPAGVDPAVAAMMRGE